MQARPLRLVVLCTLAITSPFNRARAEVAELEASYRFLVNDHANGGVLDSNSLPRSFDDSAEYWGAYVCKLPNYDCAISDVYNSADYSLTPAASIAGELQVERANVHNGTNIYDAATWQIAVMLGHVVNGFAVPNKRGAYALASKQTQWLSDSKDTRAVTRGDVFFYNGQPITDAQQAYAFRMLAHSWLVDDPFKDTDYASLLTVERLPANPDYQLGRLSWTDWKPITGENAWAFLIGPLQAAYIHHVLGNKQTFVPFHERAVQSALKVLASFAAMQSPLGAVYYAPAGTLGNQGKSPVNPHQVSVENNFSLYAGLNILRYTLQAELAHEAGLSRVDKDAINAALTSITIMIDGGRRSAHQTTKGLLSFFHNAAWSNGEFVQGGLANDPQQRQAWVATLQPKAVDVNTWGIAALGTAQIDQWFGFGAAYKNWQQVKRWGAYRRGGALWGVGYSDQDGNGMNANGAYKQGVLSAEWTAGAISMVRNMLRHYQSIPDTANNHQTAQEYVHALKQDEMAMLMAIQTLRFDVYQRTEFPAKPDGFGKLLAQKNQPYLYASKRYAIPFGWYANPLPSTCATAWMLMIADDFDPLSYAGKTN